MLTSKIQWTSIKRRYSQFHEKDLYDIYFFVHFIESPAIVQEVFSPLISEALETLVLGQQEKFSIEMATMRLVPWNLVRHACDKSK